MQNPVNNPDHYTSGNIECWDYLKDNMPREAYLGGLEWNIKKYLHRWRYKEKPLQDLKKARVYLDRLINELEQQDVRTDRNHNDSPRAKGPDLAGNLPFRGVVPLTNGDQYP